MVAVPGGKFVLASDVVGVDAEREIADLHRRLELAVAEVRAWRVRRRIGADWVKLGNGLGTAYLEDQFENATKMLNAARAATDADPVLAKMIGGAE
jgi:hypothetical protein